jgi:hypothetical protein
LVVLSVGIAKVIAAVVKAKAIIASYEAKTAADSAASATNSLTKPNRNVGLQMR